MELADRRHFERELDLIKESTNPEVQILTKKAEEAYRTRKWEAAKAALVEAQSHIKTKVNILDFLVKEGAVQSRSQARRAVDMGLVKINDAVVRRHDQDATEAQSITIDDRKIR